MNESIENLSPFEVALVGWCNLWRFPQPKHISNALAVQINQQLAAVAAALSDSQEDQGEDLEELLSITKVYGGEEKPHIEKFLAALHLQIQDAFDQVASELQWKSILYQAENFKKSENTVKQIESNDVSVEVYIKHSQMLAEKENLCKNIKSTETNMEFLVSLLDRMNSDIALLDKDIENLKKENDKLEQELSPMN